MRKITATVCSHFEGRLIKDFLREELGFSSSLIKRVKFGGVFVNEKNVHMRQILNTGDTVSVNFAEEESPHVAPVNQKITVLYEDEYILAVDKPQNMPTHPSRYNSLVTLAETVRAYIGRPFVFRAITRLDRDTSGIVLIAKDQLTASILSADMKASKFEKQYCAILARAPEACEGVVDAPIEREAPNSIKRTVREDGKPSFTRYRISGILPDGRAICYLTPITGRTHQIRVHMAHIGAPLYNDFLYGKRVNDGSYFLRCCKLSFLHPYTRERITVSTSAFEDVKKTAAEEISVDFN